MSEHILSTSGLTMRFGGVTAVDNVDFNLRDGELRCLLGPNGAGKSTFFKCLTGQLTPTEGKVTFSGQDITGAHTHDIVKKGVGIKTQVPNVFDGITAYRCPVFRSLPFNVYGAGRMGGTVRSFSYVEGVLRRSEEHTSELQSR